MKAREISRFAAVTYHFGLSLWYEDRSSLALVALLISRHSSVVRCEYTALINLCDYWLASVNMAAVQSHVSTGSAAPDQPTGETSDVGSEMLAIFFLYVFISFSRCFHKRTLFNQPGEFANGGG